MKILYAFQGTGNGHVSRAMEIIPALQAYAKTDVLMSGTKSDLKLPVKINYQYQGLSYQLCNGGGINLTKSFRQASLSKLCRDIRHVPVKDYDLIINDFEPITAWASLFKNKLAVSLSHQTAVLAPEAPKPVKKDLIGIFTLKSYAPCHYHYGFHFQAYNKHIHTPMISKQIREISSTTGDHITVYLPSYSEEFLINLACAFPQINWEIFTNTCSIPREQGHVKIMPLDKQTFIQSMSSSYAILCGAGFETPAEAIFLGKRLAVVPTIHQYEQYCNAAALSELGITVFHNLNTISKSEIEGWFNRPPVIKINYPDQCDKIINNILSEVEQHISKPIPAFYYNRLGL